MLVAFGFGLLCSCSRSDPVQTSQADNAAQTNVAVKARISEPAESKGTRRQFYRLGLSEIPTNAVPISVLYESLRRNTNAFAIFTNSRSTIRKELRSAESRAIGLDQIATIMAGVTNFIPDDFGGNIVRYGEPYHLELVIYPGTIAGLKWDLHLFRPPATNWILLDLVQRETRFDEPPKPVLPANLR